MENQEKEAKDGYRGILLCEQDHLTLKLVTEILETLPYKPNAFRKRVRKVINVVN